MSANVNTASIQYRKLTETPIPKLIISLGIPTILSMLITNVYNMADSFFVSQISLESGSATSVVFGLMSIIQAFGFMFGHGAGSRISRLLGAKEHNLASKYATAGFFWSILFGALILTFGFIFFEPLLLLLGSTENSLPYAKDYATWILIAAPFMTASCVLNNVLRYEGMAKFAMIGLTAGGLLNIGLDPLFIYVFKMGIFGAGLATAISQIISFSILLTMFLIGKTQSKLSARYFNVKASIFLDIVVTGFPSLVRQGLNSVSTMVLNGQAKPFGDEAIAAMGYVARTASLIFSVGLGIGQGFQPVSAFNYGAKLYSRVKKGSYFTLWFGMAFMGTLATVCFIFAPQIISLFRKEVEVINIGATALRVQCVFLLSLPVSVVATMLFQSVGKSVHALILSCLQSGAIFIPLCIILTQEFGVIGLQISQPIAYFITAFVSLPMMLIFFKKLPADNQEIPLKIKKERASLRKD